MMDSFGQEKISFDILFSSIQVCSDQQASVNSYLEKTFETLIRRVEGDMKKISRAIFTTYLDLPLVVSNKVFKLFDVDSDGYLSQSEFTEGMSDLYFGSSDKIKKNVFTFLGFMESELINREDVKLILTYLNSSENLISDIEFYVAEFFGERQQTNFEEYVYTLETKSANILILILIFLYKKQPFSEDGLKYFKENSKINLANTTNKFVRRSSMLRNLDQIIKPTPEILRIMKYHLKPCEHVRRKKSKHNVLVYEIIHSDEENEEDSECEGIENENMKENEEFDTVIEEDFEDEENDRMGESTILANNNKLFKFTKKPLILFTSTHKPHFKKENFIRSSHKLITQELHSKFSQSTHHHHSGLSNSSLLSKETNLTEKNSFGETFNNMVSMDYQNQFNPSNMVDEEKDPSISSTSNPPESLINVPHFEIDVHKLTKENKLIKQKMVIIEKDLFLLRFSVSTNTYLLDSMYSLSGAYVTACVETKLLDRVFFPIALLNSFGNTLAHLHNIFFFKKKTDVDKCLEFFNKILNIRELQDDFEVKNSIGRGQFGKVKLGLNKKTSEKVAIKIIEKKRLKGDELELVKTEIDVMNFLKYAPHVNVVKPIDFYEDKDNIYMVMEYLSGGTLNKYLISKGQVMSESITKALCKQVAGGLNYLHKVGIIHRDIKPENIMLLNSGGENSIPTLKIADFGLSKVMSKNEKTKEGFGTLVYTSPEILFRKTYDTKVDVWSYGVLVFYINSGLLPFDGVNLSLKDIANKICHEELSFNSTNFSSELKLLIRKCLIKNPSLRIDFAGVLKCDWFNL